MVNIVFNGISLKSFAHAAVYCLWWTFEGDGMVTLLLLDFSVATQWKNVVLVELLWSNSDDLSFILKQLIERISLFDASLIIHAERQIIKSRAR